MKGLIEFIKTTAIGGLVVIIPATIVLLIFGQLVLAVYGVGLQLAEVLPPAVREYTTVILLLAVVVIVASCFVTGLLLKTSAGLAIKQLFAKHVAGRIPMYSAISSLTQRFIGVEGEQFAPIEIDLYGAGSRALGFLVEDLPDGRCAVFVPSVPVATVGRVYLVPRDSVHMLETSTSNALTVISQWGVDSATMYGVKA